MECVYIYTHMTLMICDLCLYNSQVCTNPVHIRLKGTYNFRQILFLAKVHFTETTYFYIVSDCFPVQAGKHRLVRQAGKGQYFIVLPFKMIDKF